MRVMAWITTGETDNLDVARELEVMREVCSQSAFDVVPKVQRPIEDLAGALAESHPDIFHFIGHGNTSGDLMMHDRFGLVQPVGARELAGILSATPGGGPEGVVLNACFSGRASHEVAPRGGWVVAMDAKISDDAATEFAGVFYSSLGQGAAPHVAERSARATLAAMSYSRSDLTSRLLPGPGYGYWASRLPRPDQRDRDALESVANAFNRSAFRTPAINEASFDDLAEALDHTAHALGTGRLITRLNPEQSFSVIPDEILRAPAMISLSRTVGKLLDEARNALRHLDATSRQFDPSQRMFLFTFNQLLRDGRAAEAQTMLDAMDQLDDARNAVLIVVNDALDRVGGNPFDMIARSSTTGWVQP